MPVVAVALGALASWGASALGLTAMVSGIVGSEIIGGIVVGALSGAVVGGLSAAITGGDIGEGILYGAVGGAVVGGISGYLNSTSFSELGGTTNSLTSGSSPVLDSAEFMTSGGNVFGSGATDVAFVGSSGGAAAAGGLTSSDMLLYSGLSAGAQGLSGLLSETPYANTKEAQAASIQAQKDLADKNNEASMAANKLAAEQRQREAELSAQVSRESLAANQTTLDKELAQREAERLSTIEQANLARSRMSETASGLTLKRKQAEAALQQQQESYV